MSSIESITSAASASTGGAAVENPGAILDRDAFLKLLVAQLKFQDPTQPADTSQMVTQSAQLTMVDRMNDIASSLDAAAASDRLVLAGTLVGREVSFTGDDGSDVVARVAAVRFDNQQLMVLAGGHTVPVGAITQVNAPVEPPAGAPQ